MSSQGIKSAIPGQGTLLFEDILYDKSWKKHVGRITINRPQVHNAYTIRTLRELALALEDCLWDDQVQIVVITGAGEKAFCTGGDVGEYAGWWSKKPDDFFKYGDPFGRVLDLIRHCGKPVIAQLNGIVAGGGNEIHVACDLSIAADHVEILQVGPKVGMAPVGGASQWLPLTIGDRRARWMIFMCERVKASQALEWGLVNEVVPAAELDEATARMCNTLLEKFPSSLRYSKIQLNFWKDLVWDVTWEQARAWFAYHVGGYEALEGLEAFVEKRKARYGDVRDLMAEGALSYAPWGPKTKKCSACGASNMPEKFGFCGVCGAKLTAPTAKEPSS